MNWPGLETDNSNLANMGTVSNEAKRYCNKPFTEMVIKPNGDVLLCCYDILGQKVMGNIWDDKLLDIRHNQTYTDLRRTIMDDDQEALPAVCKSCNIYSEKFISTS